MKVLEGDLEHHFLGMRKSTTQLHNWPNEIDKRKGKQDNGDFLIGMFL